MSETQNNKRALRRYLRAQRASLGAEARERASAEIAGRLFGLAEWRGAEAVLCYLSFGDEVATGEVVRRAWAEGKRLAAPRVTGPHQMEWHWLAEGDSLERGRFGILEPAGEGETLASSSELELECARATAIVPALAFDKRCRRIGYGGGFYDTFLAGFGGHTVGLCFDALLQDDLAALGCVEPHDEPIDVVVTERDELRRA